MKLKRYFFLGIIIACLMVLSGCIGNMPYNPDTFKANPDNCWPCYMYEQAFSAIEKALNACLGQVAENAFVILEIALLYWLVARVGKIVVSLGPPDLKKEISDFAVMGFKVILVALMLKNSHFFFDIFGVIILQPIGKGFLEMSGVVLRAPGDLGVETTARDFLSGFFGNDVSELSRAWKDLFGGLGGTTRTDTEIMENSKMFGPLAMQVQYIVFQIYDALWRGVGLGFALLALGDFSALCAALLLIGGMFWLLLRIPLNFIDAFLRIGLVMLLMPLLLVGWLFSYPPGIVKKVLNIFFAGFFDILFTCIYIAFLISLFRVYESQELPHLFSAAYQTVEGGLRTDSSNFGTDFLILTLLTWCMLLLSGKIQDFAGFFFEGVEKSSIASLVDKGLSYAWKATKIGFNVAVGNYAKAGADAAKAAKDAAEDTTGQKLDTPGMNKKEGEEPPKEKKESGK